MLEALNAPVILILLYALAFVALFVAYSLWRSRTLYRPWLRLELAGFLLGFVLLGVGLGLLGAAYLHDVWYC